MGGTRRAPAVTEATRETASSGSRHCGEPVISKSRTAPVKGARTIAAKLPAMPKSRKAATKDESRPKSCTATRPKEQPISAPRTSSGKKIPPGAPEEKLSREKRNFPSSRSTSVRRTKSPAAASSTSSWPDPSSAGAHRASTPAARNGRRTRTNTGIRLLYWSRRTACMVAVL